jgi:tRNA splicing ligase
MNDSIDVVLEGGPTDLPVEARTCQVDRDEQKVKVQYYGGYEHFERVEDSNVATANGMTIFRWTGRTRIAE